MMSLLAETLAPVFRGVRGQKIADVETAVPVSSESGLPPLSTSVDRKRVRGLPEIDYPSPFVVRNTFIDTPCEPSSLDGFFEAREVQSCPTSGVCGLPSDIMLPAWKPSELLSRMPEDDGSARSRSTSASGRSTPTESEELDASSSEESPATLSGSSSSRRGLPEFDYPSQFLVKNTFIDAAEQLPFSLVGFFEERRTASCPCSAIELLSALEAKGIGETVVGTDADAHDSIDALGDVIAHQQTDVHEEADVHWADVYDDADEHYEADGSSEAYAHDGADVQVKTDADNHVQWPAGIPPPPLAPPVLVAASEPLATLPPLSDPILPLSPVRSAPLSTPAPCAAPEMLAPRLLLSCPPRQFLRQPEGILWNHEIRRQAPLGSPQMPTIGSERHQFGDCKPCAYAHSKGCGNGAQCPFCHLCPLGELKRRQKAKRSMQRAAAAAEARYR